MNKKLLSLLISSIVGVTMITGCGGSNTKVENQETEVAKTTESESSNTETADSSSSEGENLDLAAQAIADRKAKAKETGEYEKIIVSFFDWTGAPAGLDRINAALSAHTEETLGLDVELMIIDSAAYGDDMKLMLSSGEQVDLFGTCILGYNSIVNNGYTYDLEENGLLDNYGAGIKQYVRQDYLDACRVGDVLYGVPPIKDYAIQTQAIIVGQEYLDAVGYDTSKFSLDSNGCYIATWDDIEDIFGKIHEAFPDKYVFAIQDNNLTQGSSVDNIAGDYYGVLMDPQNSLEITDVYSSDLFKTWCERMYKWNQAGYISQDAMTDDTGASARVKSGSYMAMMSCSKPGYITQITGECGRPVAVFDVGESFMSSSSVSAFPWCMNQNTEDPIAAMQVLNALYSDPVVSNLVCWGEEGKEYKVNDDGTITYADGVDANNSEYYPNVLWMMPNPYVAHVWQGDPLNIGELMADFNDNCQCKSKALGFTWDNSEYATEYTALKNAYDNYSKQVVYGFVEPEKGIAELENALKAAGLEEYMAAKQEALNAWAAENGIK